MMIDDIDNSQFWSHLVHWIANARTYKKCSSVQSGGYVITCERLNHKNLFNCLKCTFFNWGNTLCANDSASSCSNPRISFHIFHKMSLLFSELKLNDSKTKSFQNHLLIMQRNLIYLAVFFNNSLAFLGIMGSNWLPLETPGQSQRYRIEGFKVGPRYTERS